MSKLVAFNKNITASPCEATEITWEGGSPPYHLVLVVEPDSWQWWETARFVAEFWNIPSKSITIRPIWTPGTLVRASIGQWDKNSPSPINGSTVDFRTKNATSSQNCDILPHYTGFIGENPDHISPTKWIKVSQLNSTDPVPACQTIPLEWDGFQGIPYQVNVTLLGGPNDIGGRFSIRTGEHSLNLSVPLLPGSRYSVGLDDFNTHKPQPEVYGPRVVGGGQQNRNCSIFTLPPLLKDHGVDTNVQASAQTAHPGVVSVGIGVGTGSAVLLVGVFALLGRFFLRNPRKN